VANLESVTSICRWIRRSAVGLPRPANYSEPVPLNSPMRALAVSKIIQSESDGYPVGAYVYGWFGWQDYARWGREQS
jgi:NADPH-dependent curcumin reductase CurA